MGEDLAAVWMELTLKNSSCSSTFSNADRIAPRLLTSAIAASQSCDVRSLTNTNPRFPSSASSSPPSSEGTARPRRPLTERKKFARKMSWIASLTLSWRTQIVSRTASVAISHPFRAKVLGFRDLLVFSRQLLLGNSDPFVGRENENKEGCD